MGYVYELHVAKEFDGKPLHRCKFGTKLLELVEQDAMAHELTHVYLSVHSGNDTAKVFYTAMGYKVAQAKDGLDPAMLEVWYKRLSTAD